MAQIYFQDNIVKEKYISFGLIQPIKLNVIGVKANNRKCGGREERQTVTPYIKYYMFNQLSLSLNFI